MFFCVLIYTIYMCIYVMYMYVYIYIYMWTRLARAYYEMREQTELFFPLARRSLRGLLEVGSASEFEDPSFQIQRAYSKPHLRFLVQRSSILHIWVLWATKARLKRTCSSCFVKRPKGKAAATWEA